MYTHIPITITFNICNIPPEAFTQQFSNQPPNAQQPPNNQQTPPSSNEQTSPTQSNNTQPNQNEQRPSGGQQGPGRDQNPQGQYHTFFFVRGPVFGFRTPNGTFIPVFGFPSFEDTFQDILNRSFQEHEPPKRSTSQKSLAELPKIKVTKDTLQMLKNANDSTECAVCQDEFKEGDILQQLPCHHVFHIDCLSPWLKDNNTCPICRFELELEDKELNKERRKRMVERYSEEGLRIMEIGSEVDRIFILVNEIAEKLKKNEGEKEKLMFELYKCDYTLNSKIFELDSLTKIENPKIKEQRKRVIVKIQSIQKVIEELKNKNFVQ